ncbi:hypothetical protein STCU_03472 [Strigomonas culicis]|uniref:Uncharacterized protein n=1 Tax=Strigomonas culicis TaxID=28005 RepID=S9TZN4_9TRYP|nr:hypothetical protein STCU_07366 [Strigomonas culicis]EPY31405.1 hypothetical protein STCU_03472 [Strigomonas culicis]|eukprot:EPY23992.1 hypothetical protein STCU_07366 [Strigomonas culicis]
MTSFHSEKVSVSQLFKNKSTPLDDVLHRPDVADYLRLLSDTSAPPKEVLTFVDKHLPKLLTAAQKTTESVSSSVEGMRKTSNSMERKRPPRLNHSMPSGSPHVGGGDAETGRGSRSSTPENAKDKEKAEAKEIMTCNINATELLAVYIGASTNFKSAIDRIVPVSVAALGRKGVLIPSVALSVQRLLLAAFEADFAKATDTIAITLDEDIVKGTIRNIAESSIVAETIIALFGSALSAIAMMAPTTHTHVFTSAWIEKRFPQHFISFLETAIKTPSSHNYFYFFRELLKRGFSHSAGPVVDVLLQKSLMVSMVETTLRSCEAELERARKRRRSANGGSADGTEAPSAATAASSTSHYGVTEAESLASNAMGVFANTIGLVRKSLIIPETPEMYFTTANYVSVVACVDVYHQRFMQLLDLEEVQRGVDEFRLVAEHDADGRTPTTVAPSMGANRSVLGMTRLAICELFTDLTHYHLGSTDRIAVECNFLQALLLLCRRYHNHDTLIRLLHKNILSIFSRPLLLGETLQEAMDRDLLVKYIVQSEREGGDAADGSGGKERGVLSQIIDFAADPAMRFCPLSTFSMELLHKLSVLPYFNRKTSGPLAHLLDPFYASEAIQRRLDCMREPITGNDFREEGSARTPPVRHRPLINLAEGGETNSISVASPSLKRDPLWPSMAASDGFPTDGAAAEAAPAGTLEVAVPAPFSPQVQAYPSFKDLFIGFSSSESAVKDDVVLTHPQENSGSV